MTIQTRPFDPAAYLDSSEAMLAYLDRAFADGDAGEIADALGVVARARGVLQLAHAWERLRGEPPHWPEPRA